jgi:hypothetical protein
LLSAPTWIVVAGKRIPVSALNVSVGGVAVRTSAIAEVGEVVLLEVEPPEAPAFALTAEVVRATHDALGLRFLALDQRALEALLEASGNSRPKGEQTDRP